MKYFKKIRAARFPRTLDEWNSLLLSVVFGSTLVFGLPALVSSVKMAFETGYFHNLIIYIAVYTLFLILIFIKRIPFPVRAWTGVATFVLLGILALFTLGPLGSGRVWLFAAAVLTALLLGLKASAVILGIIIGTIIYITARVSGGTISWELAELYSPNTWITTSITFLFLCLICTISLGLMVRGLRLLHQESENNRQKLLNTTKHLEKEIEQHQNTLNSLRDNENLLRQAQKMEAVGLLAGGIAHDLNNILSPVIGYAELLSLDTDPKDPRYSHIDHIYAAGMKAKEIVHQLLAFARKQPLDVKPVDLNRIIGDFKNLLRRTIREDIHIICNLTKGLPMISADAGQMEQILMNLAINAQDAMPHGGNLTIETTQNPMDKNQAAEYNLTKPGKYVKLTVTDDGQGIDYETLQHIFDPFFTTKEKRQGTGLGLATVYGIIKQHNGAIQVFSERGNGTRFTIFLPTFEQGDSPQPMAEDSEPAVLTGSETIVIVEDDKAVRELARETLQWYGYMVYTASGPSECLRMLETNACNPQLIITDVIMPDMNGKKLFHDIRQMFPKMKVIYMSGYTNDVISHHGVLEEGIHFIQKPFGIKSFAEKVRSALDETC